MRAAAFLAAVSWLAVPVGAQSVSTPPLFDIREIPIPQGWSGVLPTAVSNGGTVAGYAIGFFIHGAPTRPFVYPDAGEMRLVPLGGEALGLNELGDVVGSQHEVLGPSYPFHTGTEGTQLLNPFNVWPPLAVGTASGVNESRQVVGGASTGQAGHAFLLQLPASGVVDLHPAGAQRSSAVAINDLGEVVGLVTTAGGTHGVLWQPAVGGLMEMADLEADLGKDFSPSALNNKGAVVGDTVVAGQSHAALLSGGVLSDLGVLGGTSSKALGVNDAGQIVGYALASDGAMRAFVWTGGAIYDLNRRLTRTPGLVLQQATAINEAGQIVAWGTTGSTPDTAVTRGFLLTPTPATPASLIADLITEIESLVDDGTLKLGQGKSLVNKLEQALSTLEAGNSKKAITMLEAFIHEVSAFGNAGILDPTEADRMIAIAEEAISSIPG
jgi:probable HAF family extracellular repeat protein